MADIDTSSAACIARIRDILATARSAALRTVNAAMVAAYWEIGHEIVEEEQRGKERADYSSRLVQHLSAQLSAEFGKGFSERNLRLIRQFYLTYRDRCPATRRALSSESPSAARPDAIRRAPRAESAGLPVAAEAGQLAFMAELTWTHYRLLMRVTNADARSFYEVECARSGWSVRELERQISSLLFERLARSRDREGVMTLVHEGHEVARPEDLVKDPYVLEFVGLREAAKWQESDLETALIDHLAQFLLELGRDLFFVARQRRVTIDGDHFHIDLVFYHRSLRCFLLIDLKVGRLTQQDIGQMLLYTGYFEVEETQEGENPPIGLILCTDKNESVVRYTLSQTASKIFASRYQIHLPTEQELAEEIARERRLLEEQIKQAPELKGAKFRGDPCAPVSEEDWPEELR